MVMASFPLPHHQIDCIKEGVAAGSDAKASSFVVVAALACVCLLMSGFASAGGGAREAVEAMPLSRGRRAAAPRERSGKARLRRA